MFRILVADDHPVFRLGLRSLIASHKGWEICGEARNGREALEMCMRLKPDLVTLDIGMPELNGVDAARRILIEDPQQRILVLTDVRSDQVTRDCLEAGVRGWVYKSDDTMELITAIEALQRHRSTFSSQVCDLILDGYLRGRTDPVPIVAPPLSVREREVLQLVGEGKTSKDAARLLGVTLKTVETHRSRIMLKLNLHTTVDLVLYAVRNEIIEVQLPSIISHTPPKRGAQLHAV